MFTKIEIKKVNSEIKKLHPLKKFINKYVRISKDDTFNNPYEPIDLSLSKNRKNNSYKRLNNRKHSNIASYLYKTAITLFIMWIVTIVLCLSFKPAEAQWIKISYEKIKVWWMKKPPKEIYISLKEACIFHKAKNLKHCIKTWLSISYAESTWKDKKTGFGLQSKDKTAHRWAKSYVKYWYNAIDGDFFYGNWYSPKSHYCMSEGSSWTKGWCPNWRKNFNKIYYNLNF